MNPVYGHLIVNVFGFPIFINFRVILLSTVISLIGAMLVIILQENRRLAINVGLITVFASFIPYLMDYIRIVMVRLFRILFYPFALPHLRYVFLIHNPETWGIVAGISLILVGYYRTSQTNGLRPLDNDKILGYVKTIAEGLNAKVPRVYYYDESSPNLYTNGSNSNPYIAISIGALELFTDEEMKAALAHEFSHIKNNENEITLTAMGLSLAALSSIPNYLINYLIRRNSEFLADEKAAAITGPKPVISALLKVASFKSSAPGLSFGFSLSDYLTGRPSLKARIEHLMKIYGLT
ncbi:MAG: M48 family metalloprotease [Nitrososphaerota archaeon]|jgi:Zn-dependent protease with chaperone function|nr:M48 family metalloprotease [Nitrososphaerota archaeon]MDG6932215.1 M48 family metalloprotease [Nitrososphaerota archaeon]MDG6935792.1 M48 family metalloprotease [Nitrososphaerota archaeon]